MGSCTGHQGEQLDRQCNDRLRERMPYGAVNKLRDPRPSWSYDPQGSCQPALDPVTESLPRTAFQAVSVYRTGATNSHPVREDVPRELLVLRFNYCGRTKLSVPLRLGKLTAGS